MDTNSTEVIDDRDVTEAERELAVKVVRQLAIDAVVSRDCVDGCVLSHGTK